MSLDFKPLGLSDKPFFDEYYKSEPQSSGYTSFVTLFTWRKYMNCELAVKNNAPYIRVTFKNNTGFFMPQNRPDKIKEFIDTVENEGYPYFVSGISESQKESLETLFPGMFSMLRTRNSDNYIYLRESLETLSGKKLHAKKNHLNKFKKTYEYEYKPIDGSMTAECIEVSKRWCERKCAEDELDVSACEEALKNMDALSLKGGAIIHKGKIIAFTLGERLNKDMALIHYEKADVSFDGVFAAINNEFILHEWRDVTYINREEDLGIEGLRKSKLSYQPCLISETYRAVRNV